MLSIYYTKYCLLLSCVNIICYHIVYSHGNPVNFLSLLVISTVQFKRKKSVAGFEIVFESMLSIIKKMIHHDSLNLR